MKLFSLKRISILVFLFLLALLVLAQDDPTDSTPPPVPTLQHGDTAVINPQDGSTVVFREVTDIIDPSTGVTTQNILTFGLIVLGGIFLMTLPRILTIVGQLLPAGLVKDIILETIPTVADAVLARATQTPTKIDDALAIATLRANGYTVTKDEAGYHTAPKPSTTPPDLPSSGTATIVAKPRQLTNLSVLC